MQKHTFILFCIVLSGLRPTSLGTAASSGLFYQPQMTDDGGCGMKIGRGNEVLEGNVPQCHFLHHKSHMT
jgi:hypothetical protein